MGSVSGASSIEWTEATWPEATPIVDRDGRRVRLYQRKVTDRPGARERRERAADGQAWCRGHRDWLSSETVRSGVCRPCANAEYRAAYAKDGASIRAQKIARKRRLAVIPAWWREESLEGPCAYGCGRQATTLDHIWPVALGGESRPGNLVPACGPCNSSKKDTHPAPWVERGLAAFPGLWVNILGLAFEHGCDEWTEAA